MQELKQILLKITLSKPFRGYTQWHRYSDKQIEVLKQWILWIAE